jgi:hypothetical protein
MGFFWVLVVALRDVVQLVGVAGRLCGALVQMQGTPMPCGS